MNISWVVSHTFKKWKSLSHVWLFAIPRSVSYQALLSTEFSRQEYWSGLPFPSPGDLPNPGMELRSPALWADSFTIWATREAPLSSLSSLNPFILYSLNILASLGYRTKNTTAWWLIENKEYFSLFWTVGIRLGCQPDWVLMRTLDQAAEAACSSYASVAKSREQVSSLQILIPPSWPHLFPNKGLTFITSSNFYYSKSPTYET